MNFGFCDIQNNQGRGKSYKPRHSALADNPYLDLDYSGYQMTSNNRPFYSCVLSYLAMNASEAGADLALIQTSLLFSCKCKLVSITTT